MAHVIVLAGGDSDERDISLLSGAAVAEALTQAGHVVETVDPKDNLGSQLQRLQAADAVFPALHGAGGEDGVIQKFLEDKGITFVGSSSQASRICFDKLDYADLLKKNKILVPKAAKVDQIAFQQSKLSKSPYVLKPIDGGSSIDTFIVRDVGQADQEAIEQSFLKHKTMLLQELIEGVEITVAVLGDKPLTVIEIIPPQDAEFDYENKYNGKTQELCPPANVPIFAQTIVQTLALQVHQLTGCADMSRTDIIIDTSGLPYVLETNTIPGLTNQSLLPKAAAQAGMTMPQVCDYLVQLAAARR